MIYPILISSIILLILNLLAAIVVKRGMQEFCASFQLFTGDGRFAYTFPLKKLVSEFFIFFQLFTSN